MDRIGQMVLRDYMEPRLEEIFQDSSYGYRAGRNAHQALASCRDNTRHYKWVIDLDIQGFFDNLDHGLLHKAIAKHFPECWVQMYVKRWLEAEISEADGSIHRPTKGTPQGGVISPLLSNLYLHYCFDRWFSDRCNRPYERYADDIIIHCVSKQEALEVLEGVRVRMAACGLSLHPQKTGIVYCGKDKAEGGVKPRRKFTFLGYDFKHQRIYDKRLGKGRSLFASTVSKKAKQRMLRVFTEQVKRGAVSNLQQWSARLNRQIRGWLNYYSHFSRWTLRGVMQQLNHRLVRWLMKSYKRYKHSYQKALDHLRRLCREQPSLFAHWQC